MWIELNFVFQFDDLFHQNESLCEIPFLGWISPIQSIGCSVGESRREEIYWWITEIWTNVKLWENLTKQIFLTNRLSLDREYTMQCSAQPHTTTSITTTSTSITSLSTLFIVNIQSLMRKVYFWNYFHFSNSSEQKIILLYDYHWGNPKPWSYCAFIFQYLHKSEEWSRGPD